MTIRDEFANMGTVTDLLRAPAADRHPADAAVLAAEAAASTAGVTVRDLVDLTDFDGAYRLFDGIWQPDPRNPPITTELLRALAKAGSYVAGAFDGDELVGACVGFFAAPAESAMHSHIAGVAGSVRGRNVGFALKLHQRAWAMLRGVTAISWTFDPLVRRNAYFNLAKLAAVPVEYLPNFYGGMNDGINGDDDTDRLLVRWQLNAPEVVAACAGQVAVSQVEAHRAQGATIALAVSDDGDPIAGSLAGRTLLIGVPPDIEALRSGGDGLAKRWRAALRVALGTSMARGGRVSAFDRAGWYVVTKDDREETGTS